MTRLASRVRTTAARSRVLLALMAAHVVLKVALWPRVHQARLSGDEVAYQDAALALRNLVRNLVTLHSPDIAEFKANVVSNGWFMPGSPIALTPLYLVVPDPSLTVIRAYAGVLTTLLLFVVAWRIRRRFGYAYACTLMVIPGLVPMWVAFSYTIWGDLAAGLVVAGIAVVVHRQLTRIASGEVLQVRSAALLGLLAIICLYLRGSALPVAVGVLALVGLAVLVVARGAPRWRSVGAMAVAGVVFLLVLAPWSLAASKALGSTVTTTTSTQISMAITFGDPQRICFGPCASSPGGIWFDAVRYSREVSAITGSSELDVQKEMASYSLQGLGARQYARDVRADFHRFVLSPTAFAGRLAPTDTDDPRPFLLVEPSVAMLTIAGVAVALTMLDLRRLRFRDQLTRTILKLLLLASMLQPFVHISTGRYWPVFAPLLGLSLAYLGTTVPWRRLVLRGAGPSGPEISPEISPGAGTATATDPAVGPVARRALRVIDVAATAIGVLLVVGLLVLGR